VTYADDILLLLEVGDESARNVKTSQLHYFLEFL
jgi:hypothetical protein